MFAFVFFALSYIVDGFDTINPVVDYEVASKALAALGVLCLLVSTILGWIGVSQVRRSAGKLYGMWLAVLDGLFFPLLAQNYLVFCFVFFVLGVVASLLTRNGQVSPSMILTILLSLPIIIPLDRDIIRRVWRAANKDAAGVPPSEPHARIHRSKY